MPTKIASITEMAIFGPFWALPPKFLRGTAAAAGIALINSIGNLGGFAGPYLLGWMKDWTGGFSLGLFVFAVLMGGAAAVALRMTTSAVLSHDGTRAAFGFPASARRDLPATID